MILVRKWASLFTQYLQQVYCYRELLWNMTVRDMKVREKQSFLGYLWVAINPLFSMVIYSVLVSGVLHVRFSETPYPVFIFCSLLPWNFFATTIEIGTRSLVSHTSIITHVAFPKEILLFASFTRPVFDLGISYLLLAALMVGYHVPIPLTIFWIPVLLFIQTLFTLGLIFFLAALNVYYRDVAYFVSILLRGWMFLSPVIYPLSQVPKNFLGFYMLNPMSPILEGYRQLIIDGNLPNSPSLLYVIGLAMSLVIAGYFFFKRMELTFADVI